MLFSTLHFFSILAALVYIRGVFAAPVPICSIGVRTGSGSSSSNSTSGSTGSNSTSTSAPHWVIYSDAWFSGENGPPDVSDIEGYNVFILSFLLTSGAADQAQEWAELDSDTRSSIKASYEAAGISLLVSAFGSTDTPTSSDADPVTTAQTMAAWVKEYDLDGIDVDYEDFTAINDGNGAVAWLADFTTELRNQLPSPDYIITHAPVAPWFSNNSQFEGGAYLDVDEKVGDLIDWYNVQFYNQGADEYTTCDGLLTESSSAWPNTALFQINSVGGVPLDKLVIGKPSAASDASNGYMDPSTLATCVEQAKGQGWNAGVMVWEYPTADTTWISTVRASAYPVS
ncbi:glycoside hydrolase family 18 protein [Laetiporus sulphureus 93-53]|uniref:chitinase n=1 Tax=Laetiporus sulphureus 93-53 TaxID=1314785 RepID=A0A165G7H5_9APHY|nr:glycoside hydrolase family 18 protein [Laetiporus sulphureus 93-53]KZT09935.1 glycoside hydrolase family 18 protein [Laetiporus sulphureus 93-53]